MPNNNKKQIDKFRAKAKEIECDESEAAFDAKLKKIVKTKKEVSSGG